MENYSLRLARSNEYPAIAAIKSDAYLRFGGSYIDRPLAKEFFHTHFKQDNIEVIVDSKDAPCGYSLAFSVNQDLFLHHLFVKTSRAGQSLGLRLLAALAERARANKLRAITLCTARDISWNAPYYIKNGFVILEDSKMPSYLKEMLEKDRVHFTPQNPLVRSIPALGSRVAMEKVMST